MDDQTPDAPNVFTHPGRARLDELAKQIEIHPGTVAVRKRQAVSRARDIFRRNLTDLRTVLQLANAQPELQIELIQNVRNDAVRQEYAAQLDQRLHDFVAAALALVDHSRNLLRLYPGSDFETEYEKRKKAFADTPAAAFVHQLRNYLLHVGQAPFLFSLSIDCIAGRQDIKVQLECSRLLEWDNWKCARDYIEQAGKAILIADIANQYAALVEALYDWLFPQVEPLHLEDIAAVNRLKSEYNDILAGRIPSSS